MTLLNNVSNVNLSTSIPVANDLTPNQQATAILGQMLNLLDYIKGAPNKDIQNYWLNDLNEQFSKLKEIQGIQVDSGGWSVQDMENVWLGPQIKTIGDDINYFPSSVPIACDSVATVINTFLHEL